MYIKIRDKTQEIFEDYLKMFKFDLIVYDEIEDFSYPYSDPKFNYPFKL
jgi:hypothetical protein